MPAMAVMERDRASPERELPHDRQLGCSVGIMAYNEEANIGDAIESILEQRLSSGQITELIVVASGCEDRTTEIVAELASHDPRVRLISQERREGKASAINLFIGEARSPVLIMVSGDVLVKQGTIESLLAHFDDPAVGMVGGHPTPVNDEATFMGHAVHLQWRLHDRIARQSPKLGEIVAFRNVVPSIPLDTAVDELSIQGLVAHLSYRLVYEPGAVVYNRGPTTVGDFLRQRRRIYAGHLRIRDQQDYEAPTMSAWRIFRALGGSGSFSTPRAATWSVGTIALELIARALGHYDVVRRRQQHVWEISATTKRDIAAGASGGAEQNVLVFHIANFQQQQLELGAHASRQLTRRVTDQIKRTLGSKAIVSIQRSGTIVAILPGDREAAARTAGQILDRFEGAELSLNGHGTAQVDLACGVIAFPEGGTPLATSIPEPMLEVEPATSIAA
jgi:glycosyltransferase involved in cell wall biosynthesis